MTVSTTHIVVTYSGNGSTTAFPVTFPFLANGDLDVDLINDSTAVVTQQTISTDYTVMGAGTDSGTVTFITAPASGRTVRIRRAMSATQPTSFKNQGAFSPEIHERAFDRQAMALQQVESKASLALRYSDELYGLINPVLPPLDQIAGKYLAMNASGEPIGADGTGTDSALRADLASTAIAKGSMLVARSPIVVSSAAELETYTPNSGRAYIVTSSDGGVFYGITGAAIGTYANNGGAYCGTVRVPVGGDGSTAFVRAAVGECNVKWFGAIGNGISDDGPKIQAAINYCGSANPVGATPTLGYARATLIFPPGVYLSKQVLTFLPFVNYVGTRATTVSAVADTANQQDSRGSIIRADVSVYNASSNSSGCLIYIPTGDIHISGLQFVGTNQINGNNSTGIQLGSHGGVATTGRAHETDGTGQNASGISIDLCTFYTFTTAIECNSLNDAFINRCRFESDTTAILFSANIVAPIGQSCEFTDCALFGYSVGVSINSGPSYTVAFKGGYFYGTQNNSQSVSYAGNAGAMTIKFSDVSFDHTGTGCSHFLINGDYDGLFHRMIVLGCVFTSSSNRAKIQLSRGAGAAQYNHAIFIGCTYLYTYFDLGIVTKVKILNSLFNESYILAANASEIDVTGNEFFDYNGVGISFSTSDCSGSAVSFNRFTNITTPLSVFNHATNDSIIVQDNFGITSAPTRGKFIDCVNNITFANLGTPANGSFVYCADGTVANPVAGGGTGCFAKRLNGVWIGN